VRDAVHGLLVTALLVVLWFLGSTWHFWPFWVLLGMVAAFTLRGGSQGLFPWVRCVQNGLSKMLGAFEGHWVKKLEGCMGCVWCQSDEKKDKKQAPSHDNSQLDENAHGAKVAEKESASKDVLPKGKKPSSKVAKPNKA